MYQHGEIDMKCTTLTPVQPKPATKELLDSLGLNALYRIGTKRAYGALLSKIEMSALAEIVERQKREIDRLEKEVNRLKQAEAKATQAATKFEKMYRQQEENFLRSEGPDDRPKTAGSQSHFSRLQENQHTIRNRRPLRGGLPSLGKRSR